MAETERLSGGRLGCIHVRGMSSPSFREVYSKLLGCYNDEAVVIVDTRFNGGGWLHDDLATLRSGSQYVRFRPRGQHISSEPQNKWQKPSIVLASEGNYSDAHFPPIAFRALGYSAGNWHAHPRRLIRCMLGDIDRPIAGIWLIAGRYTKQRRPLLREPAIRAGCQSRKLARRLYPGA